MGPNRPVAVRKNIAISISFLRSAAFLFMFESELEYYKNPQCFFSYSCSFQLNPFSQTQAGATVPLKVRLHIVCY
jgi:hypothetical protein